MMSSSTIGLMLVCLTGCSFWATSSHPRTTESGARTCAGGGSIVVDGLVGVVGLGLGTATIIEDRSSHGEFKGLGTALGIAEIAVALPWVLGAITGIMRNGDCHHELRASSASAER